MIAVSSTRSESSSRPACGWLDADHPQRRTAPPPSTGQQASSVANSSTVGGVPIAKRAVVRCFHRDWRPRPLTKTQGGRARRTVGQIPARHARRRLADSSHALPKPSRARPRPRSPSWSSSSPPRRPTSRLAALGAPPSMRWPLYLDADVVMHQAPALPYGGSWHGHRGIEDFMAAMSRAWTSLEFLDRQVRGRGRVCRCRQPWPAPRTRHRPDPRNVCHAADHRQGRADHRDSAVLLGHCGGPRRATSVTDRSTTTRGRGPRTFRANRRRGRRSRPQDRGGSVLWTIRSARVRHQVGWLSRGRHHSSRPTHWTRLSSECTAVFPRWDADILREVVAEVCFPAKAAEFGDSSHGFVSRFEQGAGFEEPLGEEPLERGCACRVGENDGSMSGVSGTGGGRVR